MRWLILALSLFVPLQAHATTYWVSPFGGVAGVAGNCGLIDGDSDPGQYMTRAGVRDAGCANPGDTIMHKAGTYTGANVIETSMVPGGADPLNMSKSLCEGDRTCIIATASLNSVIVTIQDANYFVFGQEGHGFKVDTVNSSASNRSAIGLRMSSGQDALRFGIHIEGNWLTNCRGSCINMTERQPTAVYNNLVIRKNRVDVVTQQPNQQPSHPIYVAALDSIVEYNEVYNNTGYAIHMYHICLRNTVRYNYVETIGANGIAFICTDTEVGRPTQTKVYDNVFKRTGASNVGFCIRNFSQSDSTHFYNNVCDGHAVFIEGHTSASGGDFKNNVCTNGNCTITNPSTLVCGGTCTTTNPTVTAASHFKDSANGDYSLIAGSSLINAGLSTGGVVPANGTPDLGPHETFTCTTASINSNVLDLTCSMAGNVPVRPLSGVTGWTVGCTGTDCGTPAISNVTLATGSSTILRFTLTGIGGGSNACAVGQTWTLTYSSTTGNVRDSSLIGWTFSSQHLHSFSNLAVTNVCTGGGTPPPGGPHIHYKLDDGTSGTTPTSANDETANNLDGTLTGSATWTTGKYGSGVNLTADSGQYIAVPYGNTVNPTSTSFTIAFGVFVNSSQVSLNKSYFGAPLGTNQRFYISTRLSTWQLGIQDKNDGNPNAASDLAVQPGWNRLCLVADKDTPGSGIGTATLYVNGVPSSSTSAKKTYTSYALAGNFELGRIANVASGGGGVFDEFKVWTSVASCTDDYLSWEPITSPWTGNLAAAAIQFYAAKTDPAGALLPLAAVNTNVTLPAGAAFAVAVQTDGTVANPSQISERLYYSCAACPSAGTDLPVPNTATTDGIEFWGTAGEVGLLTGAHGANLSGALTHVNGGTNLTADSIPVFDLAQNNSTVMRWILRITPGTAQGRQFCLKPREQSGVELNGYTPAGGACVTVGPAVANGGP